MLLVVVDGAWVCILMGDNACGVELPLLSPLQPDSKIIQAVSKNNDCLRCSLIKFLMFPHQIKTSKVHVVILCKQIRGFILRTQINTRLRADFNTPYFKMSTINGCYFNHLCVFKKLSPYI
jgi:hypothetical protein